MDFGSWGWKSGSDRPGWAGSPGSPYRSQPALGSAWGSGPLIVPQGVCLMHYNEPHNTPQWPGGDFGVVTSPAFPPPTTTVSHYYSHGRKYSSDEDSYVLSLWCTTMQPMNIELDCRSPPIVWTNTFNRPLLCLVHVFVLHTMQNVTTTHILSVAC